MQFVAIDMETANADMASICQIGLVKCENGILSHEWKTYVDPEDYFEGINVSIHGIDEKVVAGAPTFPALADTLHSYLDGTVVVCHTHFDRVAMHQAARRYGVSTPKCTWLDSARVARRTWKEFAWRGYGLSNVCQHLGYEFKHHDALEDAKAAAQILLAASKETGLDLEGWLRRVRQPIDPTAGSSDSAIRRKGNPEGPLYGEVLVFTGALEIPRRKAADLAAAMGCQVASGVTKNTTMLVVGDQDITRLAGHEKSSKHRKAEELIEKGTPIRIVKESDFEELARVSNESQADARCTTLGSRSVVAEAGTFIHTGVSMVKKGLLQYYGLDTWWQSVLTPAERERVESLFQPLGSSHARPLTEAVVGQIIGATATPASFLSELVGWLRSTLEDLVIRRKIRDKMTELVSTEPNVISRHFSLQVLLSEYYRDRDVDPSALAAAINACRQQIAIAPAVAIAMRTDFPGGLPGHGGYQQLAIILEKQKSYTEAIGVCEEAKRAGWGGDWDKRIARCTARRDKAAASARNA